MNPTHQQGPSVDANAVIAQLGKSIQEKEIQLAILAARLEDTERQRDELSQALSERAAQEIEKAEPAKK